MADQGTTGIVLQDAFGKKGRKTIDFTRADIIASLQTGDFEQFRGALLELREEAARGERAQKEASHLLTRVLDTVMASEETFRAYFPQTLRGSLCATLDNLAAPIELDNVDLDTEPTVMPWSKDAFAKLMDSWDRVTQWQLPFHSAYAVDMSLLQAEQAAKRFARCADQDAERAAAYGQQTLTLFDDYYAKAQAGTVIYESSDFVDPLMEMIESSDEFISATHIQHAPAVYLTTFLERGTPAGESNFYRAGVLQALAELLDQHEKPPEGADMTLYNRIMNIMEKLIGERPDIDPMTSREFDEQLATAPARRRNAANDISAP